MNGLPLAFGAVGALALAHARRGSASYVPPSATTVVSQLPEAFPGTPYARRFSIKVDPGETCHAPTAFLVTHEGDAVGHVQLSRVKGAGDPHLDPYACTDDIRTLGKRLRARGFAPTYWVAWRSEVSARYRGKGYGVDLYEAVMRYVAQRFGQPAIVFPERCMEDGTTSLDADTVYGSLMRRYEHEGSVISSIPLERPAGRRGR